MTTYRVGDYILHVGWRLRPLYPQGYRRLYLYSVNWWALGIGPLYIFWSPIRSQQYLRRQRVEG